MVFGDFRFPYEQHIGISETSGLGAFCFCFISTPIRLFFCIELKVLYWSKNDLATVRDEVLSAIKTTFERESITFVNERIYISSLPSSVTPLPSSF